MSELSDEDVKRLLPILSSRARAAQGSVDAFRPPQTGIVDEVASGWHHFVVGRRGVGKSMLLLAVAQHAREQQQPVAYIDIETLRDNPYPDVLIRLLIAIAKALEDHLSAGRPPLWRVTERRRSSRVRRRLRNLSNRLRTLLHDPQEAVHRLSEATGRSNTHGANARAGVSTASVPGLRTLDTELGFEQSTTATSNSAREALFTRTKLEGLRAEAVEFREVLQSAVEASGSNGAVVILDDFYFIRQENQPDVLSYLQQVVKNLNIWLKVGAVEHRLHEFEDGDPRAACS